MKHFPKTLVAHRVNGSGDDAEDDKDEEDEDDKEDKVVCQSMFFCQSRVCLSVKGVSEFTLNSPLTGNSPSTARLTRNPWLTEHP